MGVTLIFPGQGSQYVGMGKNLLEDSNASQVFGKADAALDFKISEMCFNGPEDQLKLTEFTQPAIVTHSIALFEKLKPILAEKNITIDRVLGHSVGEYSALVAAGSLHFENAVKAVNLRGKYMQEAVPAGQGAMYAILRVPSSIVTEACENASDHNEKVMPANFNEPGQTVISGHSAACERAVEWLKNNYEGRQMAMPLKVSAPFHSTLMRPAEKKLEEFLNTIEFKNNDIAYLANVNANEYAAGSDFETIRNNLVEQVCGSVLWSQSISKLPEDTKFIEVGPGKVLTGLNKKINKAFQTYTLDNGFEGLEEFLA
jgi:[acyl-carrier-protein] S-malonyltransferase